MNRMKFGRLEDVDGVDFALPPDAERTPALYLIREDLIGLGLCAGRPARVAAAPDVRP